MDPTVEQRINTLLKRDIAVGVALAGAMWLTLLFVFLVTARIVDDDVVVLVLGISAVVLGLFNTLSLLSLISRYRHERAHVYGEDIAHLDANRSAQRLGSKGVDVR